MPEDSVDTETYERLILDYDGNNGENFSIEAILDPGEQCISLPNSEGGSELNCDTGTYSDLIDSWDYLDQLSDFTFPYFRNTTDTGIMEVTFTANYCSQYQQERDDSITLQVQECIDWDGGNHHYPYVPGKDYHKYVFDSDGNIQYLTNEPLTEEISPFLANHVCCVDGFYASNDTECFKTEPGCYGQLVDGYIKGSYPDHYVHEEIVTYCSGDRGNICGDGSGQGEAKLFEDRLVCGKNNYNGCSGIHEDCQEQDAWGIIEGSNNQKYWCNGEMGCQDKCEQSEGEAIVYLGSNWNQFDYVNISSEAKSKKATENQFDSVFNFGCGCDSDSLTKICDSDYDFEFGGTCIQNGDAYFCSGD